MSTSESKLAKTPQQDNFPTTTNWQHFPRLAGAGQGPALLSVPTEQVWGWILTDREQHSRKMPLPLMSWRTLTTGGWEVPRVLGDLLLREQKSACGVCWQLGDCFLGWRQEPPWNALAGIHSQNLGCGAEAGWGRRRGQQVREVSACWVWESQDWASAQPPFCLPLTSSKIPLKASFPLPTKSKKFLRPSVRRT